jgi:hypothetical protein
MLDIRLDAGIILFSRIDIFGAIIMFMSLRVFFLT